MLPGCLRSIQFFYWVGGRRLRFPGEFLEADKSKKDRKWIVGYKTADIGKKQV